MPKQPAFDPFNLAQEGDACKVCQLVRLTFEPPSLYCFGCAARIKRNQVRVGLGGLSPCTIGEQAGLEDWMGMSGGG